LKHIEDFEMLGLNDKEWLVEMLCTTKNTTAITPSSIEQPLTYETYFGFGHSLRLFDNADVFKVSPAGLALGSYLVKSFHEDDGDRHFLDMGTGSGALALLLRSIGIRNIVATDISAKAIALAAKNELLNFSNSQIRFTVSDLFTKFVSGKDRFDTIIFNPPGWRTPSSTLLKELCLDENSNDDIIAPTAMFYGDRILLRFLTELPNYLNSRGQAIIGINSLVGIQDVLNQYKILHQGDPPLRLRLLERHSFPMLFYSNQWKQAGKKLLDEFAAWRKQDKAAYSIDSQGNFYWSYELVKCSLNKGKYA
jgi:release factor glutamine methyltransferase